MDTGRICQPVVRVDDVEIKRTGDHACNNRIVVDFFKKIVGIASRELYAAQIIGAHIVEIGINMVAEAVVQLRTHQTAYAGVDIVAVDIAPCHRHLRATDYVGEAFVFIAERLGDDEGYVHVATLPHALCQAVAGGAQPSEDMRREFPAEH